MLAIIISISVALFILAFIGRMTVDSFASPKAVIAYDRAVSRAAGRFVIACLVVVAGGIIYAWLWSQGYVP